MSRYKVLPLPFPYRLDQESWDMLGGDDALGSPIPAEPILNRYGWYYDRVWDFSWIESPYGCFMDDRTDDFLYELSLFNHRPLTDREVFAIAELQRLGICPKKLTELLRLDEDWRYLRVTRKHGKGYRRIIARKYKDKKVWW